MDRKFMMTALGYAIVGLALGVYMGMSQNHGQMVTHAHIMLVGFVVSFVYAVCHKLWLNNAQSTLASVQFHIHQAGSLVMFIGLFLLYGRIMPEESVGPVLGIASITVLVGMVLMKVLFLKSAKNA